MIPVFTDLKTIPSELVGGSVAIGNFDGVHLGHACLIRKLVQQADDLHGPAIVLTFDPPPIALLNPKVPLQPPITPMPRRAELLGQLGVNGLIALPTSQELLRLTPHQFFDQVLVRQLRVKGIVEGPNFRFGKDRTGDTRMLAELCSQYQIAMQVVDAENNGGEMISSSRVRGLLAQGNVDAANTMLMRPFQLSGLVSQGAGRGHRVLVPTANFTQVRSLVPAQGVYGGVVRIEDQPYLTAINIGSNPTFGETQSKIELHLIGWQGDLYGQFLSCDLLTRVRDTRRFSSKEELLKQIRSDIDIIVERLSITGR